MNKLVNNYGSVAIFAKKKTTFHIKIIYFVL